MLNFVQKINGVLWSQIFCSEEIIDNHIKNYLEHSDLNEEEALKKN